MKFLFLMDPLEGIKFNTDTTFMLMLASHNKGHKTYYLPKDGISLIDGKLYFHVTRVTPQAIEHKPFIIEHSARLSQDDVHAVFVRPDPPFDGRYLMNTWLLDHLPKHVPVVNNPAGVRAVNEKVWAAQFKNLAPPTVISSNKHDLLAFIAEHKNTIAKPTDAFGGRSVFHVEAGHANTHVILETLSQGYHETIIVQKYVPEAKNGDKRILLLNGEILGAILRVHGEGDHRNNLYAGGTALAATINERDRHIVDILKPHLRALGLYFVGIDILGDRLIEVNVTSPTCLQEMDRLYNARLEEKVIDFVEKLVELWGHVPNSKN
ncbi:MAG: glutathione synthase [Candidatus Omnitrophica bacterium]|nr:glutathione synthase [Candidatus Omnitrophota bacterium]